MNHITGMRCPARVLLILLLFVALPHPDSAQGKAAAVTGKPLSADTHYTAAPVGGLPSNMIFSLGFDLQDRPWVGTYKAASVFDGEAWRTFVQDPAYRNQEVNAFLFLDNGRIWFGGAHGLSLVDGDQLVYTFTAADGMTATGVQDVIADDQGNLWTANLPEGVSRYDGSEWRQFTSADGLADNWVHSAAVDAEGNLWFGSLDGASRYDGQQWRVFSVDDGLADPWVSDIALAPDGHLWFATDAGISEFDGQVWHTHLQGRSSRAVVVAGDGTVWAAGSGFVSRWDGNKWQDVQPAYFEGQLVTSLALRRNGEVWAGSLEDGVTTLMPQTATASGTGEPAPSEQTPWQHTCTKHRR